MLVAGGWDQVSYDISSVTFNKEFVGILSNGQKCLTNLNNTVTNIEEKDEICDECIGVAYASKKGRWIFRCGGKDQGGTCKLIKWCIHDRNKGNFIIFPLEICVVL